MTPCLVHQFRYSTTNRALSRPNQSIDNLSKTPEGQSVVPDTVWKCTCIQLQMPCSLQKNICLKETLCFFASGKLFFSFSYLSFSEGAFSFPEEAFHFVVKLACKCTITKSF